jgi:hypothetical protein
MTDFVMLLVIYATPYCNFDDRKNFFNKTEFKHLLTISDSANLCQGERTLLRFNLNSTPPAGIDLIKLFWSKFTHDFLKDRPFHNCQEFVS